MWSSATLPYDSPSPLVERGSGGEAPTLILALGNPLRGDDGVGAAILDALAASGSLPEGVNLLDGGTAGLETALLLHGYARAFILDAADMGAAPGEWKRWRWRDVALMPGSLEGTLHGAGLAEALALGEVLGILPEDIVIYGVQPVDVGWSPGLSEPVQQAIPAICRDILDSLIQNDMKGRQSHGEDSYCGR